MLTWRAGAAGADVACGTILKVQCGTEAMWQSPGGPREAQVALMHGRRPRRRAHADAREGRHVADGRAGSWRAHGHSGTLVREGGGVTQLVDNCAPLFKRASSQNFLRVGLCPKNFSLVAGDVDAAQASDAIGWQRSHGPESTRSLMKHVR